MLEILSGLGQLCYKVYFTLQPKLQYRYDNKIYNEMLLIN